MDPSDDTTLVSPRFTAAKLRNGGFSDRVDVYEDRLAGWYFSHGRGMLGQPGTTLLVLGIALGFLESYEVFRRGQDSFNQSEAFFKAGLRRVFGRTEPPLAPRVAERVGTELYRELRCGMFHVGLPGAKVALTNDKTPIAVQLTPDMAEVLQIRVNPRLVFEAVMREFEEYVQRLRDPKDPEHSGLRDAFEAAWVIVHKRAA